MRILSLVLFLFGLSPLWSQKYPLITYSTEDGLPQSQVTAFAQDDKGFLWIGTLGGLARFGGQEFLTYSSKDGILNNRISSLDYFDGTLWIGHDGGISYMKGGKFQEFEFSGSGNDRSRKVSKILKFKGKILVCSIGGGLFEFKNKQLRPITLPKEDHYWVRGAYEYKGTLFLATRSGVLSSTDGEHFKMRKEYGVYSYSGITGLGDKMFLSTYTDGCLLKDMKTGKERHFSNEELVYSVTNCYYDRLGRIWLGTRHGITRIEKGEITRISMEHGLPADGIERFFFDGANNLWIGSLGKGMFRFPNADFVYYDLSTGFPSDLYLGGFHDRGNYYYTTFDRGVFRRSKSGEITPIITDQVSIWCSAKNVDGKYWFGGDNQLSAVDIRTGALTSYEALPTIGLPGWKITALYRISSDMMYIGGNGGVSLYKNGKFERLSSLNEMGTVRDFQMKDGKLYCVTNLGLFVFEDNVFKIAFNITDLAYNLELDPYGNLWYGTEEGLYRIRNGKSERVNLLPDPGSNFIDFLYARKNEMYVGTNNGLFILSDLQATNPKLMHFGVQDGVIDLETNLNSGFFDAAGDFWFGTASGLMRFHPEENQLPAAAPKINLVSVLLNYQNFQYDQYSKKLSPDGLPLELNLPYQKNNLVFEFDGVSLKVQGALRYQFLVEGLNDTWSPPSESQTITLTSVPDGNFVLRVRCLDHEERVSEEFVMPFTINAPFYRTWWFIFLCILFLAGIVWIIFRLRIRRLAELNEQEMLVYHSRLLGLEQKSMNASMNRHFIFNALNSIQYFINTQDRVSANKYLTNFAKLIRKNLDSVTAGGNVITLEEEIERLELYLSLESMRFKDRFTYDIRVRGVDPESVLIPPMLMQPFIENSIIHGILPNEERIGTVLIDIFEKDGYLHIRIEDNGIGIHNSLSRKLTADGDHRSQGMEITSKRIELIQKMSNNGISLEGPEEIIADDGSINGTYVLIKIAIENLDN